MNALLVALLLSQAPDAPLKPALLIDANGTVTVIQAPLLPGTVCYTRAAARNATEKAEACAGTTASLEQSMKGKKGVSVPVLLAIVAATAAVVAAGTVAAMKLTDPKR